MFGFENKFSFVYKDNSEPLLVLDKIISNVYFFKMNSSEDIDKL